MRTSPFLAAGLLMLLSAPSTSRAAHTIDRVVWSASGGLATAATHRAWTVIGEALAGPATGTTHAIEAGFLTAGGDTILTRPTVSRVRSVAPNPFQFRATIAFELARATPVTVRVFDTNGRLIRTLADRLYEPGRYTVEWDGVANDGTRPGAGVYFCQFQSREFDETRRLLLIR